MSDLDDDDDFADDSVDIKNGDEETTEGESKFTKKEFVLLTSGAFMLLVIIGGLIYWLVFTGEEPTPKPTEVSIRYIPLGSPNPDTKNAYIKNSLMAALISGRRKPIYVKISIYIECKDEIQCKNIEDNKVKLGDSVMDVLREMRPSDLRGAAGHYKLKEIFYTEFSKVLQIGLMRLRKEELERIPTESELSLFENINITGLLVQ